MFKRPEKKHPDQCLDLGMFPSLGHVTHHKGGQLYRAATKAQAKRLLLFYAEFASASLTSGRQITDQREGGTLRQARLILRLDRVVTLAVPRLCNPY